MNEARCNFNPCEWYHTLYLSGGGTDCIETFDPANCNFRLLPVRLPEQTPCCVFVVSRRLVVLSGNFVTKFEVIQEQLRESMRERHPGCNVIGNMAPVVDEEEGKVYLSWWGNLYRIAMNTWKSEVISSITDHS